MSGPPATPEAKASARRRLLFSAGAALAALVTVVFATVGDGVESDSTGLRGILVDYGHTLVWALLTAALLVAAVGGRWQRICTVLATAALVVYGAFLGALLF